MIYFPMYLFVDKVIIYRHFKNVNLNQLSQRIVIILSPFRQCLHNDNYINLILKSKQFITYQFG